MKRVSGQIILVIWLIHLAATSTSRLWELSVRRNRTVREVSCKAEAYPHEGICCLKCPAGTYVKEHCTETLQDGTCEACDYDTYTEHENGLNQCLSCTKCPPDQVPSKTCTRTSNTECQCKEGYFCLPHHACEVCKKCSKCKEDEFENKRCTPISNTICEKKTATNTTVVIVLVCVVLPALLIGGIAFYFRKTWPHKLNAAMRRNNPHRRNVEENVRVTEDRPVMKEATHRALKQLVIDHAPGTRRLVPVNGEESLKKSFDLFEEVDVLFHKRFFRHIGLSDNDIRSVEHSCSDDKMYALLRMWMERKGMKACLNDLIDALLYLDQRLSAENIIAQAVESGLYTCEETLIDD
ncbi:hematopoietic death receptor isoform X2 [Clupea harengus]|uniref:Hematopoietic death receptor isoform X2 n=1 Tax=Clupea harengus TaxID=7950 RepID=A0A6P8FCT4_CLUHA|nr:hematopoietic death receptor isoform X2 [Clupea harengus]